MTRILRAVLLTSLLSLSFLARADEIEVDDPTYLDGFVGLGGAIQQQLTSQVDLNSGDEIEKGTRENFSLEFARVRKHISLIARVGIGKDYSDYGAIFRAYKHWKFNRESTTGVSLGLGAGAMYSQGRPPPSGIERQPFADVIVAPFVRYIWDWGIGAGMAFDLEYQVVPYTVYTSGDDVTYEDVKAVRNRFMLGLSILFEVD